MADGWQDAGYKINKREIVGAFYPEGVKKSQVLMLFDCPGLMPKKDKHFPKNGKVDVTFFPDCQSFRVDFLLRDKKKKTITKYYYKLRKLPGKIIPAESTWETKTNAVEIRVKKETDTEDWTPFLIAKKCLDMVSSDSDDSISSDASGWSD